MCRSLIFFLEMRTFVLQQRFYIVKNIADVAFMMYFEVNEGSYLQQDSFATQFCTTDENSILKTCRSGALNYTNLYCGYMGSSRTLESSYTFLQSEIQASSDIFNNYTIIRITNSVRCVVLVSGERVKPRECYCSGDFHF